jgi:hypothetical protein
MEILTRPSKPADLSLVFDSWLNQWRTSKFAGVIPNHKYYEVQRGLIEDLFARGMRVTVAHPEGHPDLIMGWVAYEVKDMAIVHYLFCKDAYLESAVRSLLVSAVPGAQPGLVTHRQNHPQLKTWRHVPELARRKSL